MPAVVLVSAKGSPGVTTAAAALAAVAAAEPGSLLVELDPGGGDLAVLTRSPAQRGLVEAGGRLRRERSAAAVTQNTTHLASGLRALMAPTSGATAESVIRSVGSRWLPTLALGAPVVMVDAGLWRPSQATAERISGADLVVVVCRSTLESVEHARHLVPAVREHARRQVGVLVVGGRPYTPAEVADHLGVPLAGGIAWDSRGVAALWAGGPKKPWQRTRLARSAAAALQSLNELAGPEDRRALTSSIAGAPSGPPAAATADPTPPPAPREGGAPAPADPLPPTQARSMWPDSSATAADPSRPAETPTTARRGAEDGSPGPRTRTWPGLPTTPPPDPTARPETSDQPPHLPPPAPDRPAVEPPSNHIVTPPEGMPRTVTAEPGAGEPRTEAVGQVDAAMTDVASRGNGGAAR